MSRHKIFLEAYRLMDEPGFENLSDLELLKAAEVAVIAREKKEKEVLEEALSSVKPEQMTFDFMKEE